jgi:hypothetical protein
MNLNRYRDYRENVTRARRRLAMLGQGEKFTRDAYFECVKSAVTKLRAEEFISEETATHYLDQASKEKLPEWVN